MNDALEVRVQLRLKSVLGRLNYFRRFRVHPDELIELIGATYQELIKIGNNMTLEDRSRMRLILQSICC